MLKHVGASPSKLTKLFMDTHVSISEATSN